MLQNDQLHLAPNHMVGSFDFYCQGGLRCDHPVGYFKVEVSHPDEPIALRRERAGDNNNRIEKGFGFGFKQEWNINDEPVVAGFLCQAGPALANHGMQNRLEFTTFGLIAKYNLSQARTVKFPVRVENGTAEIARQSKVAHPGRLPPTPSRIGRRRTPLRSGVA